MYWKLPCAKSLAVQWLREKSEKTWNGVKIQKGHGQQPYGRRDCCGGRGCEVIPIYTQTSPDRLSGDVFMCVYASALAEKAAQQFQQGSAVEIAEHSCCTSLWYLPCKTG